MNKLIILQADLTRFYVYRLVSDKTVYLSHSDGFHAKITRGILSSGIEKDCGDDGAVYSKGRVGVVPGGGSAGDRCAMTNRGIYTEEAGHCSDAGVLLIHI